MQASRQDVAQAQIVDAIAEIQEAILLQGELEVEHALALDPCGQGDEGVDAGVRKALMASEDAMIAALQALPSLPEAGAVGLAN